MGANTGLAKPVSLAGIGGSEPQQTHWWIIIHWFSASIPIGMVKIATFDKSQTIKKPIESIFWV